MFPALHALETTGDNVDAIKPRSDRKTELKILNWLTPIDYGRQQSDSFRRHQPGTGQWVLDSDQFRAWITTPGKALFCPGIPGAGKTIVASVVINHLIEKLREDPSSGLAYVYCDFRRRNEQTVEHFLSSLLKQLAEQRPALPGTVRQVHERHEKSRTKPSLEELLETIHGVTKLFSRVFLVVDALDECQESNDCLSRFLSGLFELQQKLGVNVFSTPRPLRHIKSRFANAISLEIRAHDEDVRKYVSGRLGELPMIVQGNTELREDIINNISRAVDGMFLLAKLHFESIIGKMTAKAIRRTLESLPTGSDAYDSAYEEVMSRIEDQNKDKRDMAKKALLWITCAKWSLEKSELQEALAVELGETKLDQDNLPNMKDVASVCAGLVAIDEDSNVVRLVHYTTQDFFERTRQKWFKDAESHMAEVCLTYLSFERSRDREIIRQSGPFPLHHYAAINWGNHVLDASLQKHRQVIAFLESGGCLQASMMTNWGSPAPTGLSLAAYFGLDQTVEALLQRGHDPNALSRNQFSLTRQPPLITAIECGHDKVVKVLLSGHANPNFLDDQEGTPLWWAAYWGYDDIVKLLMEKGANPNHRDKSGVTVLAAACARGHASVVETLLPGAQIDLPSRRGPVFTLPAVFSLPLLIAVEEGHVGVIKVLLKKGAAAGLEDWSQIALSHAVDRGYAKVAQLSLRMGANPHQSHFSSQPPIRIAARKGYADIVEILLAEGADPDDLKPWKHLISLMKHKK